MDCLPLLSPLRPPVPPSRLFVEVLNSTAYFTLYVFVVQDSGESAWKAKPSWYLLTTEDKMIPPDAQRQLSKRAGATVVEVKGSHAIYVSQPQAVAHIIEAAAKGALVAEKEKRATSVA